MRLCNMPVQEPSDGGINLPVTLDALHSSFLNFGCFSNLAWTWSKPFPRQCWTVLLLRQQVLQDKGGKRGSVVVPGYAKAALIGSACGIASAAFWLLVASILTTIYQLPPPMKALPLSWLCCLLAMSLTFILGLGDTASLRPRRQRSFWVLMLLVIGLALFIELSPGTSEDFKLGAVNAATYVGYALFIGNHGERVKVVVQRHRKACSLFLILGTVVLVSITVVFQLYPPL